MIERYGLGAVVTGEVVRIPRPGAIGIFVDVAGTPGFVDVLSLPRQVEAWPAVGVTTTFEVLTRRPGQLRLWPLDQSGRFRAARELDRHRKKDKKRKMDSLHEIATGNWPDSVLEFVQLLELLADYIAGFAPTRR